MDLFIEQILDGNGDFMYYDISVESAKLKVVDGSEEILNRVVVGLSTYVGENILDPSYGVDYFNNVYGHEVDEIITQDTLKAAIAGTRGVTQISSFSLTRNDRTAILTSHALTTQGEIDLVTEIST